MVCQRLLAAMQPARPTTGSRNWEQPSWGGLRPGAGPDPRVTARRGGRRTRLPPGRLGLRLRPRSRQSEDPEHDKLRFSVVSTT